MKEKDNMTRTTIALAAIAALAVPQLAQATVTPECTTTGVKLTWHDFRPGLHAVTYSVDGQVPTTRLQVSNGTTTDVPLPGVAPYSTVTIRESWGPSPRESLVIQTTARCEPVPPVAPEPPTTTPEPPVPPQDSTPPPAPPAKPVTCAQLRARGAGIRWLRARGCVTPPKRCPKGTVRRVIRPSQGAPRAVCVRSTPPRRVSPPVTG